ncbi:hypothetical protein Peur_018645 [Populus x canadensis]
MGQQQSKEELLFRQVKCGNKEGIKNLCREGARLEWIDKEGKTPLILACLNPQLFNVAKTLIELGANVNAYRPANALVMNDDCQTPLEVARAKGYGNVVRAIEDAQPRTLIALWKAYLEEPKFQYSNPTVLIIDNSTKTRIKLAPANERDKQQLQWFWDACKGIPQVMHPPEFLPESQNLAVQATAPPSDEDPEIAMAINASIQSATTEQPISDTHSSTGASSSTSWNCPVNAGGQGAMDVPAAPPPKTTSSGWAPNEGVSSGSSTPQTKIFNSSVADVQTATDAQDSVPSAPPTVDELIEDGPIHYPSIDSSPLDISSLPIENFPENTGEKKEDERSSSCVICLDAPVKGACIPCGHMVGCMSCLKEIKAKKFGCPVCRGTINQVVRLYVV